MLHRIKFSCSIFWDIDGVLFTLEEEAKRAYKNENWGAFMTVQLKARPIPTMVMMARATALEYNNIMVTARSIEYDRETEKQLKDNNIPFDEVLLRPTRNLDSSPVLKLKIFERYILDKRPDCVALIIDDRRDVIEAFKTRGISTLLYTGVE